jgi:hypothetical protein
VTDIDHRINECEEVIGGLKNHPAFQIILKDNKKAVEFCDACWHTINLEDKDKILELKYEKLAAEKIVRLIETYEQELESLKQQTEGQQGYADD